MFISKSNFLIIGLATSGMSATKELISRGAKCMVYDESTSSHILKNKEELLKLGAVDAQADISAAVGWADVVVLSPGIPIDHTIPVLAKRMRKRIIGEMELGSMLIKAPIVAVTGTNGKTTTCSIIYSILNAANVKNELVGNIGSPICSHISELDENSLALTEVSSFQLETVHTFCPHIAVILNITPDHLSRHYNLENYTYLKHRILFNMRESEIAVLNRDDEKVSEFAKTAKCKVVFFSRNCEVDGAYVSDGNIFFKGEFIMSKSSIPLEGEHNLENVLASVCVAKCLKIDNEKIVEGISNFNGVKHRIELVSEIDGVKFFNDSKATNVDATIKAIDAMTVPTVIILGGKDKGLEYDELFTKIKNSAIVHAVLTGETKFKMLEAAKRIGFNSITVTNGFESAVKISTIECPAHGAVLLSPATSSFDMFSGFEERGNAFIKMVNSFNEE